jgi:ABC-type lipoprotein export system ATPase subunit
MEMAVFTKLNKDRDIILILVTHNPEMGALTDRRVFIRVGTIEGDDRSRCGHRLL